MQRLAVHSECHAEELRRLEAAEAEQRREREVLEWAAGISTRAEEKLRALERKEAEERRAWQRVERCYRKYCANLLEWNEVDHPRQPAGTSSGGQFAPKSGAGGGASSIGDQSQNRNTRDTIASTTAEPAMLELAHVWHHTKNALDQAQRDIKELPQRIANERGQLGTGGRYAYIHSQNLAKHQRDLEAAKALVPQLQRQLDELQSHYRDLGYDEKPYSTWTPAETLVWGKGIEQVGRAIAMSGTPAGLQTTGIEFDVVSAALAGPAVLRAGSAILTRALGKSVAASSKPTLVAFSAGGKTSGLFRSKSGDVVLTSGKAGPAALLPKGTPGFNAITSTHVEGHAAAIMRQEGIRDATVFINNPQICLPCRQSLAHMIPPDGTLTVVLPDGTSHIFIGNAR